MEDEYHKQSQYPPEGSAWTDLYTDLVLFYIDQWLRVYVCLSLFTFICSIPFKVVIL